MATYRVLTPIEYPPSKRAEAGRVVDDIPAKSVKWLLEQGIIEVASGTATKVREVLAEEVPADDEPEEVEG